MIISIIGSRDFNDYDLFKKIINEEVIITKIISGGAKGTDTLAEKYALENNIKFEKLLPNWNNLDEPCIIKYHSDGKSYNALAGINRNTEIIEKSEKIIIFWDGTSKGTKDSLEKAKKLNKKLN